MAISRRQRKQFLRLLLYFLAVAVAGVLVVLTIGPPWNDQPWGIPVQLFAIIERAFGVELTVPYFFVVGLYLGPLFVMTFLDRYKYLQGLIVWAGLALATLFVFLPYGLLVEPLLRNLTLLGVAVFLLGVATGMALSGVRSEVFVEPDAKRQYPMAVSRLRQFTAVIVVLGLFEAAVRYESPVYVSADRVAFRIPSFGGFANLESVSVGILAGVVLYWGLGKFLRYKLETQTIQIGPQRSGKTATFGGLYAHINEVNPGAFVDEEGSDDVQGMGNAASYATDIKNGNFPPSTGTGDINPLSVVFDSSGLFKEKIQLQGVDYAGEKLADVLRPAIDNDGTETDGGTAVTADAATDGDTAAADPSDESENESNPTYSEVDSWSEAIVGVKRLNEGQVNVASYVGPAVWNCVNHADRVVFTVPFDDFVGPIAARNNEMNYTEVGTTDDTSTVTDQRNIIYEEADTYYYLPDRADRPSPDDYLEWYFRLIQQNPKKEYVLVVTKCDHAKRDFGKLSINNKREFREYIFDVMSDQQALVEDIVTQTNEKVPFALWYPIENDEEPENDEDLRIDTDTGHRPILRGAKSLRRRLER